jgi:hypothetical protein
VLCKISHRHHVRTTGRGGEIHRDLARFFVLRGVLYVGLGAGGLEDDLDLRVVEDGLDTFVGRLDPLCSGPLQALGLGFYAGHHSQVHMPGLL